MGHEVESDNVRKLPRGAILCVVGARPNFVKISPILRSLSIEPAVAPACLIHTGQHYDAAMKETFFSELQIPEPDVDLEVGSASHAVQTAEIMRRFEPVLDAADPLAVLVVGDVNSTLACALVAAKKGVPVIHVEAGLRSFDRSMPEEINRVLTDQLSELLFTTEAGAQQNLVAEGIDPRRIHFVGNVMIDTLVANRWRAFPARRTLERLAGRKRLPDPAAGFAVVTVHRPSNVDAPETLATLVGTLVEISARLPVVFPVHPRTLAAMSRQGLDRTLDQAPRILALPPVAYLEMLGLLGEARIILTDSGGMQEEATALGIPCLTLRENTERPITVAQGTNTVVGSDRRAILTQVDLILATGGKAGRVPELWDGRAAARIRDVLAGWLVARPQRVPSP